MKTQKSKNTSMQAGFTIVELLIVIIIIGILASLVIITYNGIQSRARNTKTLSAVQAYRKGLIEYATVNGSYPITGGVACLGEGYTCSGMGSQNAAFNNAIRPFMGNANPLPSPSTNVLNYYSGGRGGAAVDTGFWIITIDGVSWNWWMQYMLEGLVPCSNSGYIRETTWPAFTKTLNSSGATEQAFGNTWCVVPLPDPSTL